MIILLVGYYEEYLVRVYDIDVYKCMIVFVLLCVLNELVM